MGTFFENLFSMPSGSRNADDMGMPPTKPTARHPDFLVGDFFTHDRSGVRFVCRAVTLDDYHDSASTSAVIEVVKEQGNGNKE
jgi:hypothetical protein